MTSVATRMTAEEFELVDDNGLELVCGEIQEKPMGANSSKVGLKLGARIDTFVEQNDLGDAFGSDLGYRLWPDNPGHVRKPDVSFVPKGLLPVPLPSGFLRVAPALAVEVVSPGDTADYIFAKIREYAEAGVRLTWIVFPESREARVYHGAREAAVLREDDDLDGEDVLPGFRVRLADVLPAQPSSS